MATQVIQRILQAWSRRRDLGTYGEDLAVRELERRGYRIRARRWRCRYGEIDVVAEEGDAIVVVEVKTRSRSDFGRPVDAVDARKQRKLIQLARTYARAARLGDATVRFDVVGVTAYPGERPQIELIRGAFEVRDRSF